MNRGKNKNVGESLLKVFLRDYSAIAIFIIIFVFALIFIKNFATTKNFITICKQASIPIIACIGMTIVLKTGGIDLSVGYIIGLASILIGIFVVVFNLNIILSIILVLLVGIVLGFFNGIVVQKAKVPAFITTLGSGYIIFGLAQICSDGVILSGLPETLCCFGSTDIFGLNTTVLIAFIVAVLGHLLLQNTVYGRALTAYGYNSKASYISGIKTDKLNISVYIICSFLATLAGILLTIRVNCAQPDMGGGKFTFEVVTAAVIGGSSLLGGKGTVLGSIFGVLIIKTIENCINIAGVPYHLYQVALGLVILFSLILDSIKNRNL